MLNVGWFSTGRGEGSKGLLRFIQERILSGDINARISFVFSNRGPGEAEGSDSFFGLVRSYGLPLATLSWRDFRRRFQAQLAQQERHFDREAARIEYDRQVTRLVEAYPVDVCMLAGYMLIVGPEMCRRWPMLNLHPALPSGPVGTWQEVTWGLIESGSKGTGAMIHLATDDLDRGPVVSYFTLPLTGPSFDGLWEAVSGQPVAELKAAWGEELPLFHRIREEEYRREPYLIAETLKALSEGRLTLPTDIAAGPADEGMNGLCLDTEIEAAMVSP